jgi:acetyl-CoA C-acetyltransferase/acetyl-CoA acyltransferase
MTAERLAIVGGARSPFQRAGTGFRRTPAADLARFAFVEALARCECDPAAIDEVILGCSGQPHDAQNLARVAALRAGIPERVPAVTVHRNCASGMEALTQALLRVRAGAGGLFLVGGVDSMSCAPLVYSQRATDWFAALARAKGLGARLALLARLRPSFFKPRIALIEALTDPVSGMIMGATAERLARDFSIAREAQDAFALESHRKAAAARREGRFAAEIAPAIGLDAGGDTPRAKSAAPRAEGAAIVADNGIREELTPEQLKKLPPFFDRRFGSVTVGNSCQVTDGAAALVVGSAQRIAELRLEPLGFLDEFAYAGLEPARMGLGPVHATTALLDRIGGGLGRFDLIEMNEAFAAQVLACLLAFESDDYARTRLKREQALGPIDRQRLNVNGGAIALGHPPGATGIRLVLTALHELKRRGGRSALATLCVGGGQGAALALAAA